MSTLKSEFQSLILSFRMFTFTVVCWILSLLTNIFITIRLEKGRNDGFLRELQKLHCSL